MSKRPAFNRFAFLVGPPGADVAAWLKGHTTHGGEYANCIKLHRLPLRADARAAVGRFIDAGFQFNYDDHVDVFRNRHSGYTIRQMGRSGGWLELISTTRCRAHDAIDADDVTLVWDFDVACADIVEGCVEEALAHERARVARLPAVLNVKTRYGDYQKLYKTTRAAYRGAVAKLLVNWEMHLDAAAKREIQELVEARRYRAAVRAWNVAMGAAYDEKGFYVSVETFEGYETAPTRVELDTRVKEVHE